MYSYKGLHYLHKTHLSFYHIQIKILDTLTGYKQEILQNAYVKNSKILKREIINHNTKATLIQTIASTYSKACSN